MTLPLTPIADVEYNIPPLAAPRRGFDLGLIIGTSNVVSTSDRVVIYSSLEEMIDDGFTTSMDEYKAAQLYFSATSNPTQIAIGRQGSGETALAALQACRAKNNDWYTVYSIPATNTDHDDIAAYIEAATPYTTYFMQSEDSAILSDPAANIFKTLSDLNLSRTLGMYSTHDHAVAAVMGYAMGQTSDAAQSAYTLKFKRLPGVVVDTLTTQQVTNIETVNGNAYINRGASTYDMFTDGRMFDAGWFDEIIYLDKLANEIQLNVTDLLYQSSKIPQIEEGMEMLKSVIARACQKMVRLGFLAPGQWNGGNIMDLKTGDFLSAGYRVLSEPIDSQDPADRDARKAPPIYVPVKLAGAIHSVVIKVNVNR